MRLSTIRLLGPLRLEGQEEVVTNFRSRRVAALLAYAAVEARPIPRAELVELLWPDKAEQQGRANLRWALNQAGKLLPGCWEIDRQAVQFDPDQICCVDLRALEAALTQGDIEALANAVAAVQGDFLAGFYLDESPNFETWMVMVREAWRRRIEEALARLIDHYARARQYRDALRFARQRLAMDPWVEESHRTVMQLLARLGEIDAALAQFESCRRILAEELGVEPTAETLALAQRLRRLARGPRHNLPAQPSRFVGRKAELDVLALWLADPSCRLVTLVGPGGVGKTRLALAAAENQVSNFLDGVTFLSLAGIKPVSSEQARILLLTALINALELPPARQQTPRDRLLAHLMNQERLLVLDNFELLLDGVDVLVEIVQRSPGVKLLVTSQERLNVRWERLLVIHGLSCPGAETDPHWQECSAVQLFVQAARRANPVFAIGAADREPVSRICRLVEGLPLGLELAASWVRVQSCAAIADEIQNSFDVLKTHQRDRPARQQSMRSVFDHSWQLLSPVEQAALSQVSVFLGQFTYPAAHEVAGATWEVLSALVDKSLIRLQSPSIADGSEETQHGAGRAEVAYDLHALVRQYAVERLTSDPAQEQSARQRHARYYAALVAENSCHLRGGPRQTAAMALMEREIVNIRAAWEWAIAQLNVDLITQLLPELTFYFDLRNPADGAQLMKRAVGALSAASSQEPTLDLAARVAMLDQSRFALATGKRRDEAVQEMQACLSVFEQHGAHRDIARTLHYLGNACYPDQLEQATGYWRRSLDLYRQTGDRWAMARILINLGVTASTFDLARAYYRESMRMCRALDDQVLEGHLMFHLANIEEQLGNYAAAEDLAAKSVERLRAVGDPYNLFIGLINLVAALHGEGKLDQARRSLHEAQAITQTSGTVWNRMLLTLFWGRQALAEGDVKRAERLFRNSVADAESTKYVEHIQQCMISLGRTCLIQGRIADARDWFERSLQANDQHDRKSGSRRLEALVHLGEIALLAGDTAESQARFQAARKQAVAIGAEAVWRRLITQAIQIQASEE
ncbi:MAG: BTAD domain-containing putative transcriptional regulator [Caldilineales bacterium]